MKNNDRPGCLGAVLQAFGLAPRRARPIAQLVVPAEPVRIAAAGPKPQAVEPKPQAAEPEVLPFHVRDDFLSPAECSFYHLLQSAAGDWAVVCPKVSLADLFFARTGDYGTNTSYRNRIARKHVDFLLCDPRSMKPLLGIELDDASHNRADRQDRDGFVDQVFAAAGLPLHRQRVRRAYDLHALRASLRGLVGREGGPAAERARCQMPRRSRTQLRQAKGRWPKRERPPVRNAASGWCCARPSGAGDTRASSSGDAQTIRGAEVCGRLFPEAMASQADP